MTEAEAAFLWSLALDRLRWPPSLVWVDRPDDGITVAELPFGFRLEIRSMGVWLLHGTRPIHIILPSQA